MSKKLSDCGLPEEVLGLLGTLCFVPGIAVMAGLLLPSVTTLTGSDAFRVFFWGLISGAFGIGVLFLARWPLYRQRRFWTFGPRELDRTHRRLYWVAHVLILVSIALLLVVWLRLR